MSFAGDVIKNTKTQIRKAYTYRLLGISLKGR